MAGVGKNLTHSAYMDILRRAFLLRAHPDRFRGHPHDIRKSQANLISALMDRMGDRDFQSYAAGSTSVSPRSGTMRHKYVLEKRDGSLLEQTIDLSNPVHELLGHLAQALEKVSATVPQAPLPLNDIPQDDEALFSNAMHGIWNEDTSVTMKQHGRVDIDRRFSVKSNQGRNLSHFLDNLDVAQVQKNQTDRMDATAAALVVRRLFSFQAVDGISLGWSSRSFAILLKSLISLHEEHSSNFCVEKFYPFRLVFSNNETRTRIDLFGGEIFLHPAWTPLQWLEESLQKVTHDSLIELECNRSVLKERQHIVEAEYGVKVKKGHSCSSMEYHLFLEKIVESIKMLPYYENATSTSALSPQYSVAMHVESSLSCRRPKVTKDGNIMVGTGMLEGDIRHAVNTYSDEARRQTVTAKELLEHRKEAQRRLQRELGLQRIQQVGVVDHAGFLDALSRMLDKRSTLKPLLAGHSLGISSRGSFCHIADSGQLVIPSNWTM